MKGQLHSPTYIGPPPPQNLRSLLPICNMQIGMASYSTTSGYISLMTVKSSTDNAKQHRQCKTILGNVKKVYNATAEFNDWTCVDTRAI